MTGEFGQFGQFLPILLRRRYSRGRICKKCPNPPTVQNIPPVGKDARFTLYYSNLSSPVSANTFKLLNNSSHQPAGEWSEGAEGIIVRRSPLRRNFENGKGGL